VLLSGFNDPRARDIMEEAVGDANDRLRAVAYTYFEHNPDKLLTPLLLKALDREDSEFVRPELTRAVAAYGVFDPKARDVMLPLVDRGQDFFRGARRGGARRPQGRLCRRHSAWAADGPLQDDAALAWGRSATRALGPLAELQRTAPRERQPAIAPASACSASTASRTRIVAETLLPRSRTRIPGSPARVATGWRRSPPLTNPRRSRRRRRWRAGAPPPARRSRWPPDGFIRNPALALKVLEQRKDWTRPPRRDAFDSWKRTTRRSASSWLSAAPTGRRPKDRPGGR
jgi:hypothetical protein